MEGDFAVVVESAVVEVWHEGCGPGVVPGVWDGLWVESLHVEGLSGCRF